MKVLFRNCITYHRILNHRKECKQWKLRRFCIECFGDGLTNFYKDIKKEELENDYTIEVSEYD